MSSQKDAYVKKKKDMRFHSLESLSFITKILNEVDAALR